MTAKAVAECGSGEYVGAVIKRLWGNDARAMDAIEKAAVSPTSTSGVTVLSEKPVGMYLRSLRHRSAAAQLLTSPISLGKAASIALPSAATGWPEPTFVAEGGAIPAVQGSFGSVTLGPLSKLAMLTGMTGELAHYSAEDAETIVTELMDDATARGLDSAVFSTTAASSVRPAGLLNGVTAITGTAGGGQAAMLADVKALVAGIVAAGGGSSILIFANPVQAVSLNVLAANGIGYPVIPAPSLAAGTVVAIERNAIASAFGGLPEVRSSSEAVIHFEDSAPLAIGTAGSPPTVAAPTRSAFQQDMLILRMVLPCTWTPRAPGMVQFVTGASW
jgi:HK97 family phage major capsid protein